MMKNRIELDIGVGKIIAEPNLKNKEQVFYRFIPTEAFANKVEDIIFANIKSVENIENELEKKLMKIYHE